MFLGISYWVWTLIIGAYVGSFVGRQELRMRLSIAKKRREILQIKRDNSFSRVCLHYGYRCHALGRKLPTEKPTLKELHSLGYGGLNAWQESDVPGVLMASTGCELTDQIFAAANEADIVPEDFFQSLKKKDHYARAKLHTDHFVQSHQTNARTQGRRVLSRR